jgi:HNH endonuclease
MRGSRSEVGATNVSKNGYHYTRTEDRWRLTHHLVAEKKLGRPLTDTERVVFVDGDKTNLDPSNIQVKRKATSSLRKREAQLIARIEELQGQLADVRTQIKKNLEA